MTASKTTGLLSSNCKELNPVINHVILEVDPSHSSLQVKTRRGSTP